MPTAVNAFILAQEYEADVETVAGAVTLSTFVSFGTVAIVTALLPAVGTLAR
jgi:predicted permease